MTAGWTPSANDRPTPPTNCMAMSPYEVGVFDLRWDDPSTIAANSVWDVVGVNIYRSDASDRGPFRRVNEFPIGGACYRDQTLNVLVSREVVKDGSWLSQGHLANNRRYSFRTASPIVKKTGQAIYANATTDVRVEVDGQIAEVHEVFGATGEVVLVNQPHLDEATQKYVQPVLPREGSTVHVTYYRNKNLTPGIELGRLTLDMRDL